LRFAEHHVEQHEVQIRLVDALRAYLAARPEAGDNLAGITRWWLLGFEPEPDETAVIAALAQLEREGLVRQHTVAGQLWWRSRPGGRAEP
jgi:hypothetical protein